MPSRSLLMSAINADLEPGPAPPVVLAAVPVPAPAPEPLEPSPMPTPGHVIAAFAPLPTVRPGHDLTREHAVCLDAYRHACGMPAWLDQPSGTDVTVTAAQINQAVTWWNSWHRASGASR